jgi:hypothetical protein
MRYRLALALALSTCCAFALESDQPLKGPVPMISATVSGAVAATWGTEIDNGRDRLTFLVLSRGTMGWVFRAGGFQTSVQRPPGSRAGVEGPDVITQQVSIGTINYAITFDRTAKTVRIGNHTVSLLPNARSAPGSGDINAVLVDGADSPAPHIVKTLWVDPQLSSSATAGIIALIRRAPELRNFIRCDLKVPDPQQQRVIDVLCGTI